MGCYAIANSVLYSTATLASGKIAGMQFQASDISYVTSNFFTGLIGGFHIVPFMVLLGALLAIWWAPLKSLFKFITTAACIGLTAILFSLPSTSHAYYDKQDWNEPYFLLTNESAFWIPDVGDNVNSQVKFGSVEYLQKNKIAAKRFSVPHVKLENSGLWSNFYVPAGRLIIVDRTPFNREWVASNAKGTSAKNEGFDVQTKEGINITLGISISAYVDEEDAPKFLYRYGVKPPVGDRKQPEVVFTSVYYGRSLSEVMDTNVRSKVQALLGNTFIKYTLDEANNKADEIMDKVEKALVPYLAKSGITLDYVGWADTFTFDAAVQDAINREYIAKKDKLIATDLAPHTKTIADLAMASTVREFGNKTDGKLPTSLTLLGVPSFITDMFTPKTEGKK
jgi:hypothetical protein